MPNNTITDPPRTLQEITDEKHIKIEKWTAAISIGPAPGPQKDDPKKGNWGRVRDLSKFDTEEVVIYEKLKEIKTTIDNKNKAKVYRVGDWTAKSRPRSEDKVKSQQAYIYDVDGFTNEQIEAVWTQLEPLAHIAHTTYSHGSIKTTRKGAKSEGIHCWRIIIPISRPVEDQTEWKRFFQGMKTVLKRLNLQPNDTKYINWGQLSFAPAANVDRENLFRWKENDGFSLDVFKISEMVQPEKPKPKKKETKKRDQCKTQAQNGYSTEYISAERIKFRIENGGEAYSFLDVILKWKDQEINALKEGKKLKIICPFGGTSRGSAYILEEFNQQNDWPLYILVSGATKQNKISFHTKGGVVLEYPKRAYKEHFPKMTKHNAVQWFKLEEQKDKEVFLHERMLTIYLDGKEITADKMNSLNVTCESALSQKGDSLKETEFASALLTHASNNVRDPWTEFLDNLPKWDGTKRVEDFFIKHLNTKNTEIIRTYSKKWFTGVFMRTHRDGWGSKWETLLVLQCKTEGIGKSKVFEDLFGEDFCTDNPIDFTNKDHIRLLRRYVLVEFAEMHTITKAKGTAVKNFISARKDTYRRPYLRTEEEYPRSSVFVGTANNSDLLKLEDENRRFWVMPLHEGDTNVLRYDPKELHNKRAQIWAEAKHYYTEAMKTDNPRAAWTLDKNEQQASKEINLSFISGTPTSDNITQWLDSIRGHYFTLACVEEHALKRSDGSRINKCSHGEMRNILQAYGCKKKGQKTVELWNGRRRRYRNAWLAPK